MNRLHLVFAFVLGALFGFHCLILHYMLGILPSTRRSGHLLLPFAAFDTALLGALLWIRLPIALIYLLLALLYIAQFWLLSSHPDESDLLLFGGMFAFILLCIRGVMIPLFALLRSTNMFTAVHNDFEYLFAFSGRSLPAVL